MNTELTLNKILSQVQKLDKAEQASLLKKIASMLKNEEKSSSPVKLIEIAGLGSSIWQDADIDKYIDEERQW
jgi:ribosomal protein L18E